ncbi:MAG: PorV/PorQ family protein [Candidatus Eisenbacteria bacterium]
MIQLSLRGEERQALSASAGPSVVRTNLARTILRTSVLGAAALALAVGGARAQSTSGAQSLNITPGARADAMGRAFVALPDDATANWWNPAALASATDHNFSLMHAQLVPGLATDVYYEYLGYRMHMPGWGGVGVSFIYLGYGKSTATTEQGYELGVFTSYEVSPQVSLGTELLPGLAAGVTLKYVYVNLAPDWATQGEGQGSGDTFGADLAMLYKVKALPVLGWPTNLGVNVQNLGPNIAYIDQDQSDPIGRNLKIGFATRAFGTTTPDGQPGISGLISYDFNKSLVYSSETPIQNVGAELAYEGTFALRTGYIYDKDGDIKDPTFGVGFNISSFTADYASVPQAKGLERVNKFSLSYRF